MFLDVSWNALTWLRKHVWTILDCARVLLLFVLRRIQETVTKHFLRLLTRSTRHSNFFWLFFVLFDETYVDALYDEPWKNRAPWKLNALHTKCGKASMAPHWQPQYQWLDADWHCRFISMPSSSQCANLQCLAATFCDMSSTNLFLLVVKSFEHAWKNRFELLRISFKIKFKFETMFFFCNMQHLSQSLFGGTPNIFRRVGKTQNVCNTRQTYTQFRGETIIYDPVGFNTEKN